MREDHAAAGTPDYDEVWSEVYGDLQEIGPVHRHMRRLVGRVLARLDYSSALEVGCGAGHNFDLLRKSARRPPRLSGVDVSGEALRRAGARGDVELARLDIERGHLDRRFDLVFSSLVLEHVRDDRAALAHMRAMSDGHLLVTTIAGDFERYGRWERRVGHLRNYARGELEGKAQDAGFEVREAIYWGWPLYSPLARRLQNRMTPTSRLGAGARLAAAAAHAAFYLNSRRRGDLLILLARAR